jgi:hypothetical protein
MFVLCLTTAALGLANIKTQCRRLSCSATHRPASRPSEFFLMRVSIAKNWTQALAHTTRADGAH